MISLAVLGLTSGFPQLGNYNSPQAAAAPAGSDYGAASAPACRTEYKQECSTTTERECTTVNEQQVLGVVVGMVTRDHRDRSECFTNKIVFQCRTVQNQQCETVNEQVCNTVQEQQCNTVNVSLLSLSVI